MDTNSSLTTPSLSGFMSIKLDRNNYPLWLAQIIPILRSRNLMGVADGSVKCPPAFKTNAAGVPTTEANPNYLTWIQQDQMILSWINNSLTPSVLSTVARFNTSHAAWTSLEKRYASQSASHILRLKGALHSTTREDLSISDFIDKLNGPMYEMTVSSAQARETQIAYGDLVALLLSAEERLKVQNLPARESSLTALYTPKVSRPQNRGGYQSRGASQNRGRGSFNNKSRGSAKMGSVSNFLRPTCQICGRDGHTAIDCYNRMNQAYEGRVPTQKLSAMVASGSFNSNGSTWYSDSGASYH